MNRVVEASNWINGVIDIKDVLDIGSRDCMLEKYLNRYIHYFGNDIVQNKDNTVTIVGDITNISIEDSSYDCVVALDILEHVDDPYTLFIKLAKISKRYLIISLPNGYDLKSRFLFLNGHLSAKYAFGTINSSDRHRWIMSYSEILQFYEYKAKELNLGLKTLDIKYGETFNSFTSSLGLMLRILPNTLCSESVLGFFTKQI